MAKKKRAVSSRGKRQQISRSWQLIFVLLIVLLVPLAVFLLVQEHRTLFSNKKTFFHVITAEADSQK